MWKKAHKIEIKWWTNSKKKKNEHFEEKICTKINENDGRFPRKKLKYLLIKWHRKFNKNTEEIQRKKPARKFSVEKNLIKYLWRKITRRIKFKKGEKNYGKVLNRKYKSEFAGKKLCTKFEKNSGKLREMVKKIQRKIRK